MSRNAASTIIFLMFAVIIISGCGEFLELEADVRIARFEPTVAQPEYDQQTGSILLTASDIYLENYSQVPVTITRYRIQYFDQGSPAEIVSLEVNSELTLYVPGVPTPDPYAPDSVGTRQTRQTTVGQIPIWTVRAYTYASNMPSDPIDLLTWSPFDYADDRPIYARITMWGESDTGEEIELYASAALSTLVSKG